MHNQIIKALEKGKEKIPAQPRVQHLSIPWTHDTQLTELHHSRLVLRKCTRNTQNKENLKQINKSIKSRVRVIQNQIVFDKAKEINEAKEHREVVKLWRKAKLHDKSMLRKTSPLQCPGLASHFRQHFNPNQTSLETPIEIEYPP